MVPSVGYDHIDIEECKKRNIIVGNTPECLDSKILCGFCEVVSHRLHSMPDAVAEHAIALALAAARRLPEVHCYIWAESSFSFSL